MEKHDKGISESVWYAFCHSPTPATSCDFRHMDIYSLIQMIMHSLSGFSALYYAQKMVTLPMHLVESG